MTIVRRPAKVLAAIGLATATVAAGLAAGSVPGGAQAAAPQATVEPASGLVDGSRVTVSVTGLPAGASVQVAQCATGASASSGSCDFLDTRVGIADGSGNASFELGVDAVMAVGSFEAPDELDCRAAGACVIQVYPGFNAQGFEPIEVPLGFAPDAPLAPPPTVTVDPHDGLVDGQEVTVAAAGLVWEDDGFALLCKANPTSSADCDFTSSSPFAVAEDRTATVRLQVTALIETGSGVVDCREPEACVVVVTADGGRSARKVGIGPIAFDPESEVVPPTLTITPDTDLVDGQAVAATGAGFTSDFVQILECPPGDDGSGCTFVGFVDGTGPDGGFTQNVTLATILIGETGSVDCRTSAAPCVLVATTGQVDSPRAARAPLHFRPDGPLLPGPSLTVTPSTDLPDQASLTITGSGFPEQGSGTVSVCRTGGGACDPETRTQVDADNDGTISLTLGVAATFTTAGGEAVDCRAAPGCEVVAISFGNAGNPRRGTAPLGFAPPAGSGQTRYLDPVFEDVEVTEDLPYRTTTTPAGQPVTLTVDIYQPADDTATRRPALVWLPGGWFGDPDADVTPAYAEAFARRGYVVAVMDYRKRPELGCCPSGDAPGLTAAFLDAHQDAVAGVAWLREHADEYRIDTRAIAAAGSEAGAATALHLADLPGQMGVTGSPAVAAAVGIGGVDLGRHDAGEVPTLALNSTASTPAPQFLAQWACEHSRRVGVICETVGYDGIIGDVASVRQRDATRRTSRFLVDAVLAPLGMAAPTGDSFTPVSSPSSPTPAPAVPTASTTTSQAKAQTQAGGALPETGMSATETLVLIGLLLAAGGAVLVALARARRRRDAGRFGLTGAVAVGVAAVLVTSLVAACSKGDDRADTSEQSEEHDMDAPGHDMDHDEEDGDPEEGDETETGHGHDDHGSDEGMDDHGAGDESAAGDSDGHGHGGGTSDTSGSHHTGRPGGSRADRSSGDSHGHPSGPGDPAHANPGDPAHANPGDPAHANPGDPAHANPGDPAHANPGDPAHANPSDPGHGHPNEPMPSGFDPNWTPEQTAYAQRLVDRTTAALPQFANPAILPLMGYAYIFDGQQPGTYQHWIHVSRILDSHTLDPQFPESLVFRNTGDGPVLEAAMYMLGLGTDLDHLPPESAFLPGWHIHTNLCFDNSFRLVGVTVNGVCERGHIQPTPPMLHVWIVDTRCGRFAGVDENGLQCEHEHVS
jgi:LPXTG-motif cell wall-anchored protein